MTGFQFWAVNSAGVKLPSPVYEGSVKCEPFILYKINTTNAFDPSISLKRGRYYEDKITVETVLSTKEYEALCLFIRSAVMLRIEFSINGVKEQYPIELEKLASLTEVGRFHKDKYVFAFKSVYTSNHYIDFEVANGYGSSYGDFYGYA
ncbi:MAG: hypothetical protein FWG98_06680 [Candidatus Cloacimonetes bacterium]|nr:hypothetical protein [Candidatus Cloacimonadota bacterium]